MFAFALLLVPAAFAEDFYLLIQNPSVAASNEKGELAAWMLEAIGTVDRVVAAKSAPRVRAGFSEAGVDAEVQVSHLDFSSPRSCAANAYVAPFDDSMQAALLAGYQNTWVSVPVGEYWGLTVHTSGVKGWIGGWTGDTWAALVGRFRKKGVEILLCPM